MRTFLGGGSRKFPKRRRWFRSLGQHRCFLGSVEKLSNGRKGNFRFGRVGSNSSCRTRGAGYSRATKFGQERKGKGGKVFQLLKGEHTDSSVSVRLPSTHSLSLPLYLCFFKISFFLDEPQFLSPLGILHPALRFITFQATPVVAAKFPSVRQTARQLRHLLTQQQRGPTFRLGNAHPHCFMGNVVLRGWGGVGGSVSSSRATVEFCVEKWNSLKSSPPSVEQATCKVFLIFRK